MASLRSSLPAVALLAALTGLTSSAAQAEMAFVPAAQQAALLTSSDPQLAANKRLVFDFWREVFEGGHMDLAAKYLSDEYIQHNPNVASGRAAFVEFFSKIKKPQPIAAHIQAPLISIVAERDLVILTFGREYPDSKDPSQRYSTTWFDMFRIANGKIVEHWDPALRR
ncbi:nuclear transport factor 2 family protein [Acidovorax sp. DW039]|uniref:nuclear transport factor 2 family protein n=1 Tax=Acidovorax sp. DW039 TaxID=3095606 RepID=UPI00308D97BB|nr:nuclear transport factor 2 family protein [Acidovorax sp. DW039]